MLPPVLPTKFYFLVKLNYHKQYFLANTCFFFAIKKSYLSFHAPLY